MVADGIETMAADVEKEAQGGTIACGGVLTLPGGTTFVPAIARPCTDRFEVQLRRIGCPSGDRSSAENPIEGGPVWSTAFSSEEAARGVLDWMGDRPADWTWWGRIATGLGPALLDDCIIQVATRALADAAAKAKRKREEAEEKARKAREIELYYFDPKGKQPALGFQRGDGDTVFKMHFREKWERERVMDWLRWQRERFAEFVAHAGEHGGLSLERVILAGMRDAERDLRRRGIATSGRRPLRVWRGE